MDRDSHNVDQFRILGMNCLPELCRRRLERLVGLPALQTDHGETELVQAVKQDLPIRPSRKPFDDNLALSPILRRSPLPSTPSCSRKPTRLRGRERKHRSRPSKYRGQQIVHVGSPLPAFVKSSRPLPDVEKLDFRINHIRDRALDLRLQADQPNRKGTCSSGQFQLPRQSNPPRTAGTTLPVLHRCDW